MILLKSRCCCLKRSIERVYQYYRITRYSSFTANTNLRVLFLGSDDFSIGSLEVLNELFHRNSLTVVVSHPDNLVAKFSKRHSLRLLSWTDFKQESDESSHGQFDVGVVASFGHLIPKKIIQRCRMGILNVHGSILPSWRGASPISHAIMNGDKVTGISIMQIAPHKFDVGPILHKKEIPLDPHIRAPELKTILTGIGAQALKEVLLDLNGYLAKAKSQNSSDGTLAPKVISEMADVLWDKKSAIEIYNQYRGLCGFFKLRTNYLNHIVDLDDLAIYSEEGEVEPSEQTQLKLDPSLDFKTLYQPSVTVKPYMKRKQKFEPGEMYFSKKYLCVKCNSQDEGNCIAENWIFVRKVKVGTKWMSAVDFNNGFLSKTSGKKVFYYKSHSNLSEEANS